MFDAAIARLDLLDKREMVVELVAFLANILNM